MADGDKELILILPKQFFVDAFIASRGSDNVDDYIEQNHYRFIANLIIEVSSSLPEYKNMAVTTSKALNDFTTLLSSKQLALGSADILSILKGLMYVVDTPSINNLGDQESMIAVADKLYVSSDYDPVIIINPNSRDNYREAAKRYYQNNNGQDVDPVAFKIYDPRQTKAFLEARFPNESKQTINRTPSPFRVFWM